MKKLLSVLLAGLFIFVLNTCAFAAGNAVVFSDEINTTLKEEFVVPVKIKNNSGLMGFKITVNYPDSQITLKNVSSGSLTGSGLFNTSVTDYYSVKGSFDVLWSDTQNVNGDGTLFMITFETLGYADYGTYKIDLTFSRDDTFDEKWKDVQLDCNPITVNILDSKSASKKNEANKPKPAASSNTGEKVSDDYLISSVQSILKSYDITDILEVSDETQKNNIVKFVNSRNLAYSKDAIQYKSFDELKEAYTKALTNSAVKNVLESVDGEKVLSISDSILKNYGVGSFSELPDEKKKEAVGNALESIVGEGGDTRDFAMISDNDTAADVLDGIVNEAKVEQDNSLALPQKGEQRDRTFYFIIFACISFLTILGFVMIKKWRRHKECKNYEK